MTRPDAPVIRISSPSDVVCVAAQLLGFMPTESIAIICLHTDRGRLGLILRYDLGVSQAADDFIDQVIDRVGYEDADRVFLAVFTAEHPHGSRLPHQALVDDLTEALDDLVIDALFVHRDRLWSYLHGSEPAGLPLEPESPAVTAVAAAYALVGRGLLPDRAAVVASLSLSLSAREAKAMCTEVVRALRRHRELPRVSRCLAVRQLVSALEALCADPRRIPADRDIAEFAALCLDVVVRDEVLMRGATWDERAALLPALRVLVQRTPPPYDAPVASILAWMAYAHGDGIMANVALDRALATDPGYSLAHLIADALDHQLSPDLLTEVMLSSRRGPSGPVGYGDAPA